jgi:hypothetical protein
MKQVLNVAETPLVRMGYFRSGRHFRLVFGAAETRTSIRSTWRASCPRRGQVIDD